MRVEFIFNSVHKLVLIPESGKDKQLLQLCFDGRPELRVLASPTSSLENIIIEAKEKDEIQSNH